MKKVSMAVFALFLPLLVIFSGCGGGGGGSSPNGGSNNQVSSTVTSQGGTISVSDASSPINGFKMVIPANALSTDTTITVQTIGGTIPLPQTVNISDSIIELLPSGLSFSKPISITIPYSGNTPPTVVTYDSASNSYSILPISSIDTQNKTETVIANHFSKFLKILSDANKPISTGFALGVDTFKINNSATAMAGTAASDGACWGFAYFSQWYFLNKKASDGSLYGKYQGNEKFVAADAYLTQHELRKLIDNNSFALLNMNSGFDAYTFLSLHNAMLINKSPQVLLVEDPSGLIHSRHAVLVYAITKLANGTWQLDINDNRDNSRNYPLIFDGLHFKGPDSQAWHGCTKSILSTCEDHNFTWFTFVGDDQKTIKPSLEAIYNKYTYSISGKVTLSGTAQSGVTIKLSGSSTAVTTTDTNGNYSFAGLTNGTYSITVAKTGYTFTPFSINNLVVNGANLTGKNFTAAVTAAIPHSISGTITSGGVALAGVLVSTTGGSAITASNGNYTISGMANGSYSISPSKIGYSFSPSSQLVTVNSADVTGLNFSATAVPRFIDKGNGTIYDTVSNLTWLKNANCYGPQDWNHAELFAVGLGSGTCGLSDGSLGRNWHMPTYAEFGTLVGDGYLASTLNTIGFSNVKSSCYWTSSGPGIAGYAYTVDMGTGYTSEFGVSMYASCSAWAVR